MTTDPARTRLLHQLGRLRDGRLLPAERDLLADAVTAVLAERDRYQFRADAAEKSRDRWKTAAFEQQSRASKAEAALTRVRQIGRRLVAHAAGFQDVLNDSDRGPWTTTVSADIAELDAALDGDQPAEAPPDGRCLEAACSYEEPHKHGFACGPSCQCRAETEAPCCHPSWETTGGARHHAVNAEWHADAEQHRTALAAALDHPADRSWSDLITSVRIIRAEVLGSTRSRAATAEQEARDARQGEAEAVRAREAAEAALTEAREKYRAGLREADSKLNAMNAELERYADGKERPVLWSVYNRMHGRAATAEAERDAARRFAEASGTRAYEATDRADLADRVKRTAAEEAADALARAERAEQRAENASRRAARYAERLLVHRAAADRNRDAWRNARRRAALMTAEVTRRAPLQGEYAARASKAEAERDEARHALKRWIRAAGQERGRAERAEATLTAVRKAVAVALQHENPLGLTCQCGVDHLGRIEAALGDPQPATESADPCAYGCRQAADTHTQLSQELDAERECAHVGSREVAEGGGIDWHDFKCDDCGSIWRRYWDTIRKDWLGEPQVREQPAEPECKDAQGCHRVVPCNPGCAVTSRALADAMAKTREQPVEPVIDAAARQIAQAIDLLARELVNAARRVFGNPSGGHGDTR